MRKRGEIKTPPGKGKPPSPKGYFMVTPQGAGPQVPADSESKAAGSDRPASPSTGSSDSSAGKNSSESSSAMPRVPPERKLLTMAKPLRLGEMAIERGIQGIAFISLLFIALIFVFVFREAAPLLFGKSQEQAVAAAQTEATGAAETYGEDPDAPQAIEAPELEQRIKQIHASDLAGRDWQPVSLDPKYGITPLLWGSLKVTLIALLIAGPIGIFAALYTSQFAPKWAKEGMKPVIEILAGFPSVVVGFFALVILASVLQNLFGFHYRLNAFVGGVAMALAVIPIVYTVSEDALAAVPKVMMEASLALGASKWETALFVILPSATPGIFAAVILGFGRAFGETMIVLMATGNAALLTPSFVEPVRTLSATIGAEMAEVVFGDTHYRVLFFIGALLFAISFSLNAIAEFFVRNRLMKKFKGA
jgi:phosphate transport system permease protein